MTEKDIEKLAELAKIRIPKDNIPGLLGDFESILGYIKQIESVDVGEVKENFFLKNIFRNDTDTNSSGILSKALLACVPETHEDFVKVNKIL